MNQTKDYSKLSRGELIECWQVRWGRELPPKLGRKMMEISLVFKDWEDAIGLSKEQASGLNKLIKLYKKDPDQFEKVAPLYKPGTVIARTYRGEKHRVRVLTNGFEYKGENYRSLSAVALEITGTKWNGKRFFREV